MFLFSFFSVFPSVFHYAYSHASAVITLNEYAESMNPTIAVSFSTTSGNKFVATANPDKAVLLDAV